MPGHRPAPLHPASRPSSERSETTRCVRDCAISREEHPRWGYRRAWASLRSVGWSERSQEDPAPVARGRTPGAGQTLQAAAARRLRRRRRRGCGAERPDQVWALDFQFDTTQGRPPLEAAARGRRAHPRGARDRGRPSDRLPTAPSRVLERIAQDRGRPPQLLRMDNGPELTANALSDWCRFGRHGHRLHRAGLTLEEPVPGILRRQGSETRCSRWKPSTRCSRRRS